VTTALGPTSNQTGGGTTMAMVDRICPKCQHKARMPNNQQVFCPNCGADMTAALGTAETVSACGSAMMWLGCGGIMLIFLVVGIISCASS